jgi:hypothetical protein
LTGTDGDTLIAVWVQPRASRSEIGTVVEGRLRLRVHSPAHDNRANEEVCRLLSRHLDVPPSTVTITTGAGSRRKVVRVDGLAASEAARRLNI